MHCCNMLDLSHLREISGGDEVFIRDILQDYLEQLPFFFAQLRQAALSQRLDILQNTAHKMKSLFKLLNADDLHIKAETIEKNAHTKMENWVAYLQQTDAISADCQPLLKEIQSYLNN